MEESLAYLVYPLVCGVWSVECGVWSQCHSHPQISFPLWFLSDGWEEAEFSLSLTAQHWILSLSCPVLYWSNSQGVSWWVDSLWCMCVESISSIVLHIHPVLFMSSKSSGWLCEFEFEFVRVWQKCTEQRGSPSPSLFSHSCVTTYNEYQCVQQQKSSRAGSRTRVPRVTGEDTNRYTTPEGIEIEAHSWCISTILLQWVERWMIFFSFSLLN